MDIETGEYIVKSGRLGRGDEREVLDYIGAHKTQLLEAWGLASQGKHPGKMEGM